MGLHKLPGAARQPLAVQLLGLLVVVPALAAAAASGRVRDCSKGCLFTVSPVCGANGVSYMNPCIAECSGKQKSHTAGYCAGDKLRFQAPFGSSPKERAFVVSPDTMAKFAAAGFSYIGHSPLSSAPVARKLIQRGKERAAAAGAAAAAAAAAASSSTESLASVLARAGSSQQQIKVEIVRGDRNGNMFTKSYMYNPAASSVYAYPPQFPRGGSLATTYRGGTAVEGGISPSSPPAPAPAAPPPPADASRGGGGGAIFNAMGSVRRPSPAPAPAPAPGRPRLLGGNTTFGSSSAGAAPKAPLFQRIRNATRTMPVLLPMSIVKPKPAANTTKAGTAAAKPAPSNAAAPKPPGLALPLPAGGRRLLSSLMSSMPWASRSSSAAARGSSISSSSVPAAAARAGDADADADADAAALEAAFADPAALHRMLSVIDQDTRKACPIDRYPFGAMGHLAARASDGVFLCSGALIAADRVLTAAHCVWDDRQAHAFFKQLAYSPGQRKVNGAVETPEGQVDWDYVTTFKAYIDDPDAPPGLQFDIAVIKLVKPVGIKSGWLGIRAQRQPCAAGEITTMTLAGYPGDDPFTKADDYFLGGCFVDACRVNLTCAEPMTYHTCDSYIGQSGAPMYDPQYYVRMVHTLGVLQGITTENSGVTISKFLLDQLMIEWLKIDL